MEKQQAENDSKLAELEKEERRIWTPSHIFESCCPLWLKDGPEILGHRGQGAKGCSGGCGKAHPRITLDYDNARGAVASISHELNPFLRYFDGLCDQGKAARLDSTDDGSSKCYHLTGFLQAQTEELQKSFIPTHLVKVSPDALAASRRAHQQQTDHSEVERVAKRQKAQGSSVDMNLLESAMEIACNHCLPEHLDVVDIAWMRLSCKPLAKFASKMAHARLEQTPLEYTVFDYESCSTNDEEGEEGEGHHYLTQKMIALNQPLSLSKTNNTGKNLFIPKEPRSLEWEPDTDGLEKVEYHHGNLLTITIRLGSPSRNLPESDCLFDPTDNVLVGRYDICSRQLLHQGERTIKENFTYRLEHAHATVPDSITGGNPSSVPRDRRHFSVQAMKFGFTELLAIYARKKLPLAKIELGKIRQKRPVTAAEKNYVKALAKESREGRKYIEIRM